MPETKELKIKADDGRKFVLTRPPNEVFLYRKHNPNGHVMQGSPLKEVARQNEVIFMLDTSKGRNGVTYPETGGMYVWHIGRKHPRKGHVYSEALRDCYYPKRILLSAIRFISGKEMIPFLIVFGLMPKKIKGRIIDKFIDNYLEIADWVLKDHYLHPQFNTDICRELAQPIMTFLTEIGASRVQAAKMALVLITILEYDMAYRLRLEDLLTETTKEKMLANPVREFGKLVQIFAERDPERPHLVEKFRKFAKLLSYSFFFVRKAFRKALTPVDFAKLQLDEIDRYQVRHWAGYNWFGMTIEERIKEWPFEKVPAYRLVRGNGSDTEKEKSQSKNQN